LGRFATKRLLAAAILFASALTASAADQIRLVVPFAAGGPVDLIARTIATELPARLNAEVIIENRGGAGGVIGTELVAKSAPDGRTLLQASLGSHVLSAALRPQLNYDPIKSFTPIVFVGVVPSLLVVGAQSKIVSLADLLAEAKRKPMSYGSAGPGTTMNIAAELFNAVTGIKTTHVPYRGAGPALNDLLGGHLDIIIADTPVLLPLVNTKRGASAGVAGRRAFAAAAERGDHGAARISAGRHGELVRCARPGRPLARHAGLAREGNAGGAGEPDRERKVYGRGAAGRARRRGLPGEACERCRVLGAGSEEARHQRGVTGQITRPNVLPSTHALRQSRPRRRSRR
jgi:hypothetical protein